MSRSSDAGNAVVYAAEQVCALYGVQVTREQSRMFNVQGVGGRWRPMFFGTWTDTNWRLTHYAGKRLTNIWNSGKADLLARPRIRLPITGDLIEVAAKYFRFSVPLWIECKAGKGSLEPAQNAFKIWVESNGDSYLLLHDDVRPLIEWFDSHGVEKRCDDAELRTVTEPIDASELEALPCKHCKKNRSEHLGTIFGCPGKRRTVWSPDLKARA